MVAEIAVCVVFISVVFISVVGVAIVAVIVVFGIAVVAAVLSDVVSVVVGGDGICYDDTAAPPC